MFRNEIFFEKGGRELKIIGIIIRYNKVIRKSADNKYKRRRGGTCMQEVTKMEYEYEEDYSAGQLYMIEQIDSENNLLILSNYFFNEKVKVTVTDQQIEFYANAFDKSLEQNMYLFVEYNESEGIIIGK